MKTRILLLAALLMAVASCQKSDQEKKPTVTPTYTVQSRDGHVIGINGVKPDGRAAAGTCGSAFMQSITAIDTLYVVYGATCGLDNAWTTGGGEAVALSINGQWYKDGSSGYGLWSAATTSITAESGLINGGIAAGELFSDFVRTYCSADTTGSTYYDSPLLSYQVASTFICDPQRQHRGKKK